MLSMVRLSVKVGCASKNAIRKFYTIIFYVGITRLSKQKQHLILYRIDIQGARKLMLGESFANLNQ